MEIPDDWLVRPTSMAEAEDEVSRGEPSDLWLEMWRGFLARASSGDEFWEYAGALDSRPDDPAAPATSQLVEWHAGYALIREGLIVDAIETPWAN